MLHSKHIAVADYKIGRWFLLGGYRLNTVAAPVEIIGTQFKFLSDPTRSLVVMWVNFLKTELMVEICSKSLVRAIGKVLLIQFS